jgi:hypothetical protein
MGDTWIQITSNSANGIVDKADVINDTSVIYIRKVSNQILGSDLIQQDALINFFLHYVDDPDVNHHFVTTSNGKNYYEYIHEKNENPKLITYGVKHPTVLFQMLNSSIEAFQQAIDALIPLLSQCVKLGHKYGFSHGDMHAGNILYDTLKTRMVLIDYGRAYIYPIELDKFYGMGIETVLASCAPMKWDFKTPRIYLDEYLPYILNNEYYFILSPFTKMSPASAGRSVERIHMILCDIAGLCFYIYINYKKRLMAMQKYKDFCNDFIVVYEYGKVTGFYCDRNTIDKSIEMPDIFTFAIKFFYKFAYTIADTMPWLYSYRNVQKYGGETIQDQQIISWEKLMQANIVYSSGVIDPEYANRVYNIWFNKHSRPSHVMMRGGDSKKKSKSKSKKVYTTIPPTIIPPPPKKPERSRGQKGGDFTLEPPENVTIEHAPETTSYSSITPPSDKEIAKYI